MHELSGLGIEINNYFDVSMAIYVANEMDAEINIDDALKLNNIVTNTKASALIKLKEIYINKLINNLQLKLFSDIELPLVKVLYEMEKTGIKIDVEQIKNLSEIYHKELDDLTQKIYTLAGEEFNVNSPKQLQTILFEKLNIAIHQFAKRQMTYFRGMERRGVPIHWIDASLSTEEKVESIIRILNAEE